MKKYIISDQLQQLIDWDNIMKMTRYAGGHDEQMQGLFRDAIVVGHWNEGDYQGQVATCVKLADGRYTIYNDYYGSCSGCDAWSDADDESVRHMCINLSNGAKIFQTLEDVEEYLANPKEEGERWSDWEHSAPHLLKEIHQTELKNNGC